MEQVGIYNKISQELKDQIPPFENLVVLQMLNGVANPEPDAEARKNQPFLFGKKQLRTQFKIKDGKNIVPIVLAEGWTDEKEPTKAKCFVAGIGETHFSGVVPLTPGSIEHEELYETLWLSPEREGSPFSDNAIPKLFRFVDVKKDSENKISKVAKLREALELANKITEEKGRELAASYNWSEYKEDWETILKARIFEEARSNPDAFLLRAEDKSNPLAATIKKAIDAGIVTFDASTKEMKLGKNLLATLTINEETDFFSSAKAWFESATNSGEIIKGIEKDLAKAKK